MKNKITRDYFDLVEFPNLFMGLNYAFDVVENKIPNAKYIKGSCARFIKDLGNTEADFYFNPKIAERYLRLVQKFEHVIGKWETDKIIYEPWQNWLFGNLIGFISRTTGFRRFRIAHIEVARGNAKSAMASQCALYFLGLDDSKGNQIATVATRKEQARIVLDSARAMARKNKSFLKHAGISVLAHTILQKSTNSIVRAMSSDHSGLDGLNDVLAICDELHAMRRETFDVIYSGMSKRKDSLTLCISTAGFDVDSVGYSQSEYAKKVALGDVEDDQFFVALYTIDEGDDIFSEETWRKANPNFGVSVDPETFRAKANKALEQSADLPNFKVKHLNMWLSEAHAFFDLEKFDLCADPTLRIEDFMGEKMHEGVDIASKIDLCSLGYVFEREGVVYIFDRSYIPEATVKKLRNTLYDNCIGSGHLIQTQGEAINQKNIKDQILKDKKDFKMASLPMDSWNAEGMMQGLAEEGAPVLEFRMSTANLSEPTKVLDAYIRQGPTKIRHNGSPLLRWCFGNVVCKYDAVDNVFPKKNHPSLKIDPVIAIIMGFASYLQDKNKGSVYEDRGFLSL